MADPETFHCLREKKTYGAQESIFFVNSCHSLLFINSQVQWPCMNEKKQKKKRGYKNSGVIFLSKCEVE